METTITLNLAGIKVNFIIVINHSYGNEFSFAVLNETRGIVMDGRRSSSSGYCSYVQNREVNLFSEALDKKVKTELRKAAKALGKKINLG